MTDGGAFYATQREVETSLHTRYDIYKNNVKIADVADYEKLQQYILQKYQNKIAYGDGKIFFDDSISIVERYDNHSVEQDTVETYEKIINEAQFVVSSVQVVELDSGDTYFVPNLKVWEKAIGDIQNAIAANDKSTTMQLRSQTEYTVTRSPIETVLTEDEVIARVMGATANEYTVTEHDTLHIIAQKLQLNEAELLLLNKQYTLNDILLTGTVIKVPNSNYRSKFTKIEVLTRNVPIRYNIIYHDDENLYEGQEVIEVQGNDGEELAQLSVKYGDEGEEILLNYATLAITREPVTQIVRRGIKEAPDVGTGKFIFPTNSHRASTEFGDDYLYGVYRFHSGLDINEGLNANIFAADNGVVVTNEYNSGYGNYVIIDHNNGYYTLYAHMNASNVRVGEVVRQGQVIGFMGTTGLSTGVHLHFEVRVNGNTKAHAQNPRNYIGY